MPLSVTVNAF
jgi:hypothetical protein